MKAARIAASVLAMFLAVPAAGAQEGAPEQIQAGRTEWTSNGPGFVGVRIVRTITERPSGPNARTIRFEVETLVHRPGHAEPVRYQESVDVDAATRKYRPSPFDSFMRRTFEGGGLLNARLSKAVGQLAHPWHFGGDRGPAAREFSVASAPNPAAQKSSIATELKIVPGRTVWTSTDPAFAGIKIVRDIVWVNTSPEGLDVYKVDIQAGYPGRERQTNTFVQAERATGKPVVTVQDTFFDQLLYSDSASKLVSRVAEPWKYPTPKGDMAKLVGSFVPETAPPLRSDARNTSSVGGRTFEGTGSSQPNKSQALQERVVEGFKSHGQGTLAATAAILLKESVPAIVTGNQEKLRSMATQEYATGMATGMAAFLGGSAGTGAVLSTPPATKALNKIPAKLRMPLRNAILLAGGMGAMNAASGHGTIEDVGRSTAAYAVTMQGVSMAAAPADRALTLAMRVAPDVRVKAAVGALSVAKLTVALAAGDQLDQALKKGTDTLRASGNATKK